MAVLCRRLNPAFLALFLLVCPATFRAVTLESERSKTHVPIVRSENISGVEQRVVAINAAGSVSQVPVGLSSTNSSALAPALVSLSTENLKPPETSDDELIQPILTKPVVSGGNGGTNGGTTGGATDTDATAGSGTQPNSFGAGAYTDEDPTTGKGASTSQGVREAGKVGKVAANMLLGFLAVIMVIFYLVNSQDEDIRKMMWSAIGNSLSILCALLIVGCIKDLGACASGAKDDTTGNVSVRMQVWLVIRFLMAFVIVELCLIRFKARPLALRAWGLMGAQVVGFMGGDAFGIIQLQKPFKEWGWYTFCVVLIAAATIGGMMYLAQCARKWYTEVDGQVDDAEHAFEKQCQRSENTYFSFAISLLVMQTIRYAICGGPRDFHGPQFNTETKEIWTLFGVSFMFALGVFIFDFIARLMERRAAEGAAWPSVIRGARLLGETCGMTMGWCSLYAGKWLFWYELRDEVADGDIMTGQLFMAILFTASAILIMYIFDRMADRVAFMAEGLRSFVSALVMLMGLAWQSVFVTAIKCKSSAEYDDVFERAMHDFQFSVVVCILIIPAWALYMLPRFEDNVEKSADAAGDGSAEEKPKEQPASAQAETNEQN